MANSIDKKISIIKRNYVFLIVTLVILSNLIPQLLLSANAYTTECTNLSLTLSLGSKDSETGGQVTLLQNYLREKGYLSTAPTGHFGPATELAIKNLQKKNNIIQTGTAGPLTRTAIKNASCPSSAIAPSITNATTSPQNLEYYNVTSPRSNTILKLNQLYTIEWLPKDKHSYNVILEDSGGIAKGFITSGLYNISSYAWTVGTVYRSDTGTTDIVPPGTYRIRVQYLYSGNSIKDEYSQKFTIESAPLYINDMMPKSALNNNTAAVAIFGSGFTNYTVVTFDSNPRLSAKILYRSEDGKIILFSIPTDISAGQHTISVNNVYNTYIGTTATSSPSNSVDIQVIGN